jgi:hypothetical protein
LEYVIQNKAEWLSRQQSAAPGVRLCICWSNKVINTARVINKQVAVIRPVTILGCWLKL